MAQAHIFVGTFWRKKLWNNRKLKSFLKLAEVYEIESLCENELDIGIQIRE